VSVVSKINGHHESARDSHQDLSAGETQSRKGFGGMSGLIDSKLSWTNDCTHIRMESDRFCLSEVSFQ
jgi:hypothetical protein